MTPGPQSNSPDNRPQAATGSGSAVPRSRTRAAQVEFFAQSVDAAGNVGITSNKIENFLATDAVDEVNGLRFVYKGADAAQSEGRFFASGAKFEIQLGSTEVAAATTKFSVDSGTLFDYDPAKDINVVFDTARAGQYEAATGTLFLDSGAHVLFAQDPSLKRVYRFFILDPTAPTVTIATGPVQAGRRRRGDDHRPRHGIGSGVDHHGGLPGRLPGRNVHRPSVTERRR